MPERLMTKCQQLAKRKQKSPRYFQKLVEIVREAISTPEKSQIVLLPPDKEEQRKLRRWGNSNT